MSLANPAPLPSPQFLDHPLKPRDKIEAQTFQRDRIFAEIYAIPPNDLAFWLATRARSRRDLLYHSRHMLDFTRLNETIHRPVANFCQNIFTTRHGFGNNRDPRGNGKTSLATFGGGLWCIIQDPIECVARNWPIIGRESRLGITTLKIEWSWDLLSAFIEHLEKSVLRYFFPEIYPKSQRKWGQKAILLQRGFDNPTLAPLRTHPLFASYPIMTRFADPTFAPGSLESGRAGAHTNGEIIDDPVNEKTWDSSILIARAIHGIRQLFNISRTETGFRLVIGNHWCPGDVADTIDQEDGNWQVFMRGDEVCVECKDGFPTNEHGLIPRDMKGDWKHQCKSETWVHLMEEANGNKPDLGQIRASCGDYHIYSAQYKNRPLAPESTLWSSDQLGSYDILSGLDSAGLLNASSRIAYHTGNEMEELRLSDGMITITYDPASGGLGPKASKHAITVMVRTPADTFALVNIWTGRPEDPLDAVQELVSIIHRFKAYRVMVGIESVGYQNVIQNILWRELQKPYKDGQPNPLGKRCTWLHPKKNILPIKRTRTQGDKITWNRETLGPLIQSHALLLNTRIRGTQDVIFAIETFPLISVKYQDIRDSLTMHASLWQGVPRRASERRAARIRTRFRQRQSRGGATTGYGWTFTKPKNPSKL